MRSICPIANGFEARSPCPGLNSLANHGFLPHDGRNISIIQICKAIWEGLGATPDIAAAGLAFAFFPWPLENLKDFRFDLEQLSTHMMFNEHDVSYSRNDAFLGDNARFNQTVWGQSLKELRPEMLTPTDFAKARQARAEDTFARNTNTTFSFFDMALSSTETSFFFTVFGSGRKTSKSMIRYFIENERLPVALGWLPRLNTNAASVALLIPEVLLGMPKIWAKLGSQTLDVLNLKVKLVCLLKHGMLLTLL